MILAPGSPGAFIFVPRLEGARGEDAAAPGGPVVPLPLVAVSGASGATLRALAQTAAAADGALRVTLAAAAADDQAADAGSGPALSGSVALGVGGVTVLALLVAVALYVARRGGRSAALLQAAWLSAADAEAGGSELTAETAERARAAVCAGAVDVRLRGLPPFAYAAAAPGAAGEVDSCVVCLDPLRDGEAVQRLPCGHVFHHPCVLDWVRLKQTCPLCKYDVLLERPALSAAEEDAEAAQAATGSAPGQGSPARRREEMRVLLALSVLRSSGSDPVAVARAGMMGGAEGAAAEAAQDQGRALELELEERDTGRASQGHVHFAGRGEQDV